MASSAIMLTRTPSLQSNPRETKNAHLGTAPRVPRTEFQKPRTIDELLRQISSEKSRDPILSYPSSGIDYVDYTASQLDVLALRTAKHYSSFLPQRKSSSDSESVVALLGPSNFEYLISILALTKLGHSVLFLSTRISIAAYVSLFQQTGANYLLIDPSFRATAQNVQETLPTLQVNEIIRKTVCSMFLKNDDDVDIELCAHLDLDIESRKIAWIIHSSGSTGLPKPIYQTHSAALNNYSSNLNMRGFITLPLYHAHGLSSVFRALHSRKQIYMYNASLPLTQQHLINIMRLYSFDIFYGVPYALKVLADTSEGINALSKLEVVMFGGSALGDALGDKLVGNGVNLISHYGTTETGQLMTSFRPSGDKAWNYVRVPESFKPYISFEMRSPGVYELIALEGLLSKVASNRPDGSYATKDLFTPHASISNAWKYFARLDDTIVLMNGEKLTPTAFEQSIRHNRYVREAVIFGSGKDRVGMLIIPSTATSDFSPKIAQDSITAAIEQANVDMPAYGQVSWEMVKILPLGTEFPRTDKGTVIRAAFYRAFETQIDEIYESSERQSGDLCLSELELRTYIRTELALILPQMTSRPLRDDTDLFSVGVDSLQAIRLRSVISKNIQTNGLPLGSNIIFDHPSIASLATELFRLRTGGLSKVPSVMDQMDELISKYSKFEPHVPVDNCSDGHYLVVTGATGSLGAHLVSQLIRRRDVRKVYCLVRASSPSMAHLRVIRSMQDRSVYDPAQIEAQGKIVAIPADFSKKSLGLDLVEYAQILSEVSGVIHCAWSVNFNLGLGSFEESCIAGAHNLIQLCLNAKRVKPAFFDFCSSVSAVARTKGGLVPEALPERLEYAQEMGYAQSKLVTEHICANAAKSYGITARILRVGQVIADTVNGIWNATEAIPLMLQAALTIGAIPKLDENPLWLPVDTVASAIAEISISNTSAGVMNVVNYRSFHWTQDLIPALHSAGLKFSELTQREWIDALRKSNPDPTANPPIKLLEFFASKYDNNIPRAQLEYDTSHARSISPALSNAPVLNQGLVDKFVQHFLATSWSTAGAVSAIDFDVASS